MSEFIIHHLTDLHIGPMQQSPNAPNWFNDYKPDIYHVEQYINHLTIHRDLMPDLLIISGDLTSMGTRDCAGSA